MTGTPSGTGSTPFPPRPRPLRAGVDEPRARGSPGLPTPSRPPVGGFGSPWMPSTAPPWPEEGPLIEGRVGQTKESGDAPGFAPPLPPPCAARGGVAGQGRFVVAPATRAGAVVLG